MKYLTFLIVFLCCVRGFSQEKNYAIVIHGGAGNFNSENFSKKQYSEYYNTLNDVLFAGDSLLRSGANAIDVVTACIVLMENSPLFNAGKGAVMNEEGNFELDASIMDGKTLKAGAITGTGVIKNPITAALAVMEDGTHVMLSGHGAEVFAKQKNIECVDQSYFLTHETQNRYQLLKKDGKGTVGAVVLDAYGNLAAGTSTGGMMMKRYGRIGDSPVIGAGTYADNNWCAVSCTGHGEYFIRFVAAYDVVALMKYSGLTVEKASAEVIRKIGEAGGTGGLIVVDKTGNIAMPFNTTSMFRGYVNSKGIKNIQF